MSKQGQLLAYCGLGLAYMSYLVVGGAFKAAADPKASLFIQEPQNAQGFSAVKKTEIKPREI